MRLLFMVFILLILTNCNQTSNSEKISKEVYNTFNKDNHLRPDFNKFQFDTLHTWDLAWAILYPINKANDGKSEIELSKRLSPGQKSLYFFWYLDAQVTNGGFIQFYVNEYADYLPPIQTGLKLIGDTKMLDLLIRVNQEFESNKKIFNKDNKTEIYSDLPQFNDLDKEYYKLHDKTIQLIENYIRNNPSDFVRLK